MYVCTYISIDPINAGSFVSCFFVYAILNYCYYLLWRLHPLPLPPHLLCFVMPGGLLIFKQLCLVDFCCAGRAANKFTSSQTGRPVLSIWQSVSLSVWQLVCLLASVRQSVYQSDKRLLPQSPLAAKVTFCIKCFYFKLPFS